MKDILWYFYHISIEDLQEYPEYSVFSFYDKTYYFTRIKRSKEELDDLLQVCEELLKKRIPVYSFIQNVPGAFVTLVEDKPYILLEVTDAKHEYGILDMMERNSLVHLRTQKRVLYRNEWAQLWSEKVDYLEYQVHELGKSYPVILSSFSYFVGLAENAICYVNHVERTYPKNSYDLVLSHKRVMYPNYRLNYDNPLNFIFDIEVRDIAEYLKSMALEEPKYALIDLKTYFAMRKPDVYQASMLYARLLYPSYYFDLHEKIMNQDKKEDVLLSIIDQVDEYEKFMKQAWFVIREFVLIEPISWILKKEL